MFGWCMEFSEGKNVSVPLEDVITNDKYSLGPEDDAKDEHFLCLERGYLLCSNPVRLNSTSKYYCSRMNHA